MNISENNLTYLGALHARSTPFGMARRVVGQILDGLRQARGDDAGLFLSPSYIHSAGSFKTLRGHLIDLQRSLQCFKLYWQCLCCPNLISDSP